MIEKLLNRAYPIFVYGTLRPSGGRYDVIQPYVAKGDIYPATVDGYRIYKFNTFPGAIKEAGAVGLVGNLLVIKGDLYAEAIEKIDRYEAVGFLFNRIVVQAWRDGALIPCWFYEVRQDVFVVERKSRIVSNNWLSK